MTDAPPDGLTVALSLARHGWHVFPCRAEAAVLRNGEERARKSPHVVGWRELATTDAEQIATWWGQWPDALVGVHADKSGLVVVDLDRKHGKDGFQSLADAGLDLPETFSYATPSGGEHHLYAAPEGRTLTGTADLKVNGEKLPGVDIRAGKTFPVYYGPVLTELPTLTPSPSWPLLEGKGPGATGDPSATVETWRERQAHGKPSKKARKAARSITLHDCNRETALRAIATIVGESKRKPGDYGPLMAKAQERYTRHYPDAAADFEKMLEGSVKRFGPWLATFPVPKQAAPAVDPFAGLDDATRAELAAAPELAQQVAQIVARDRAVEIARELRGASIEPQPLDWGTADEILARDDEPEPRIDGLIPAGGSVIVPAQHKAGKSTLALSLAHALVTGDDALDRFPVRAIDGAVAYLNYEMTPGMLAQWWADLPLSAEQRDRLVIVNLRGRENPLSSPAGCARLAAFLRDRDADAVIVDTFGASFTGTDQNSASEVSRYLADLDRVKHDGQVGELILLAHAGWGDQGRTRGSSALEGWADSILRLTREGTTAQASRMLEAIGRDVDVPKTRLEYDPATRLVRAVGESGATAYRTLKRDELAPHVLDVVGRTPGIGAREVYDRLRALTKDGVAPAFRKGDEGHVLSALERDGRVKRVRDGRITRHYLPADVPEMFQPTTFPRTTDTSSTKPKE